MRTGNRLTLLVSVWALIGSSLTVSASFTVMGKRHISSYRDPLASCQRRGSDAYSRAVALYFPGLKSRLMENPPPWRV